jgi:hypothetical protein
MYISLFFSEDGVLTFAASFTETAEIKLEILAA